ncbi:MAG: hypothetical protein Q8R37_03175 [Nanoarchaeota archaeon]|nr:hypothetical protein [Nanoarchaeota archaeon]
MSLLRNILLCFLLVTFLVIITGCTQSTTNTNQVVCNKPYILVGTECCLDKNDNSICDRDETGNLLESDNGSNVKASSYTLSDLQADIGNVLIFNPDEFLVLQKDKEFADISFFAYQPLRTNTLGITSSYDKKVNKVLPYRLVTVSLMSENPIKPGEELLAYVKNNEHYFSEHIERNRQEFIESFQKGDALKLIQKNYNDNELSYISHSLNNQEVIVDETILLESVSQKIVLRHLISLDHYNIIVNRTTENYWEKPAEDLTLVTGLNYLQSATIFCTPENTITIYNKNIHYYVDFKANVLTDYYKNQLPSIISDAQALINMCEKRYEFSYLRER